MINSQLPNFQPPRRRNALALGIGSWLIVLLGVALSVSQAFAQSVEWPTERAPRPLPAREVKFPPFQVKTLSNGMQVITVAHHEQPAVTMRMLVRAGAAQDPEGKGGLAELVAKLLDQGTTTRSAQQVADQIDSIGGAMGTGSGTDLTFVNAVVMKDSFALAMDLVSDVIRRPAFSLEEIERQREQALSSLKVSVEDPSYVASMLFDRLVYGFHPYGRPGSGTPQSLQRISQDDLRAFHRQYFVPNNMGLTPFASAGAGYVRQLHEEQALVETGHLFYVGGGFTRPLFSRSQGLIRAMACVRVRRRYVCRPCQRLQWLLQASRCRRRTASDRDRRTQLSAARGRRRDRARANGHVSRHDETLTHFENERRAGAFSSAVATAKVEAPRRDGGAG